MARPIKPTPILKGKDARRFTEKLRQDAMRPVKLPESPSLEKAKQVAFSSVFACAK
jgi:hypothetical protein